MKKFCLHLLLISLFNLAYSQDEARLLRFPDIYENQLIFSYAGDLYTVDKTGGIARKLTTDEGYEMFARFSPDGSKIAFTAQYDGNTEVYLMQSKGSVPKRLTYTATLSRDDIADRMGPNNLVMTWKDDTTIVYRSRKKSFIDFKGQLFIASVNEGISEEIPLPCAGFCSFNTDKSKLAFNKVFREFRTWKYYKGGMADDIWIYDFKTEKTENITNNPAQDIIPMWLGNKIYFISDRDKTMNLFCYDISSKETKKITNFTEFDIKFPSYDNNSIVFENGGYIYLYDVLTQKTEKINIIIADDQNLGRNKLVNVRNFINSYSVSPDGKRVIFDARGDIFTVPANSGITRNITQTSGAHDREPEWSPDGKYIAFISDMTGEDEIYIKEQEAYSEAIQITHNGDTYKYALKWSPDSKKILWSDRKLRLQFVDIESKEITQADSVNESVIRNYTWSPDSKWLAYTIPSKIFMNSVYLYNVTNKWKCKVTDSWYSSGLPSFSSDGKYLFFTSNRDFNPVFSWTEWNYSYSDMSKIYFVTLSKITSNPLKPTNDEVEVKKEIEQKVNDKKNENTKEFEFQKKDVITVDTTGIKDRVVVLPLDAAAYWDISSVNECLYYMKRSSEEKASMLMMFDMNSKKETLLGNCNGYEISNNKKKMLIYANSNYYIIDIPKNSFDLNENIDLSNMSIWINQKAEWKEIYDECWRQMRDFFYAPNMNGVDWKKMYEKYLPLISYVNHRADLTYIIGELIGELSTSHTYVGGGDSPKLDKIHTGLLGAELSKDTSGYFKIDKILKGENWHTKTRSPLTEVGVNVNDGDYIIAVNGKNVKNYKDIYQLLVNTAGKQTELEINSKPFTKGCHKEIVIPVSDESDLYYYNWVQHNTDNVDKTTNSQVGYIHIPDMTADGLNEFVKHFSPQLNKKALIIDVRGNSGGNVSSMIIERLSKELELMAISRNAVPEKIPKEYIPGPKVCLIDNYSASDGDIFPYKFKKLGIGKLIGKRTWGGIIGISSNQTLIDGGYLNKPENAHYSGEGKGWIIEGGGVEPDIKIDNDPAKEYKGEDEQLNTAIKIILEEMKNYELNLPIAPAFPDKIK